MRLGSDAWLRKLLYAEGAAEKGKKN